MSGDITTMKLVFYEVSEDFYLPYVYLIGTVQTKGRCNMSSGEIEPYENEEIRRTWYSFFVDHVHLSWVAPHTDYERLVVWR